MPNRWWTKKEQTALDRARKSVEEIRELRQRSEAAKEALRSAVERRDVEETARLMTLTAAFGEVLASARPVEPSASDVADAVKKAVGDLGTIKDKILSLAPPPGAFVAPLARGAAMRGDEHDVDRWLTDGETRDAVKLHIGWWKRWRAVSDGLRAENELRKVLSGARPPYDAPSVLDQAENELKTIGNMLAELEILLGKIERVNGRYVPTVGVTIDTTRPGAERFRM